MVQPIGGITRTTAALAFGFDLDAWLADPTNPAALNSFDNDLTVAQNDPAASGLTFNIYNDFAEIFIDGYVDGDSSALGVGPCDLCDTGEADGYSTVRTASAVPAPAALPLLGAAMAGLGLAARRRRRTPAA